jgi:hypothetical protein
MTSPDLPLGYYRHFKGAIYRVAGLARDCETQRWTVYYQCCYGDWSYWLRPYDNFCEHVLKEGLTRPRFEFISAHAPTELEGEGDGS